MQWNEEAESILRERFGGDNEMALATCRGGVPSVRTVNAVYREGCFLHHHLRSVPEDGGYPSKPCCGPLWGMVHLPRHGGEPGVVWPGGKQGAGRPPASIFRQLD